MYRDEQASWRKHCLETKTQLCPLFTFPCQTSPNGSKSYVLHHPQLESDLEVFENHFTSPIFPLRVPGLTNYKHTKIGLKLGACSVPCSNHCPLSPVCSSSFQEFLCGVNVFSPWRACLLTVRCVVASQPWICWEMAIHLTVDPLDPSRTWS